MAKKPNVWEDLQQEILGCHKCDLALSRTQAVPGVGPPNASLVIIGEAPGQYEDLEGEPFVGAAGKLLTKLLAEVGIKRGQVFITNVVKCRPPENRQPTAKERKVCNPYLVRQIKHIKPRIIALVGRVPAETILETSVSMRTMHGKTFDRNGYTFFVMYHPAAGLYNQNLLPVMETDMQKLKEILDTPSSPTKYSKKRQMELGQFFENPEG